MMTERRKVNHRDAGPKDSNVLRESWRKKKAPSSRVPNIIVSPLLFFQVAALLFFFFLVLKLKSVQYNIQC